MKPEHTLNICPRSLFLSAANARLRPESPLQEYSVKNTAACHCCCFRLELVQMILYEVMDLKTGAQTGFGCDRVEERYLWTEIEWNERG